MSETDKQILKCYAENDMSMSKTAKEMNYHRNSIAYHMKQIKSQTGLNPCKFYDLVKLLEVAK